VAKEYWVTTNRGMLRVKWFRQPDDFVVRVFDSLASKEPMHKWTYKLDRGGLCQTYDTSAGVGLSGRMSADVGRKRKGLSFRWLIIAACMIPILFWFAISKALAFAGRKAVGAVSPASVGRSGTNGLPKSWESSVVSTVTGGARKNSGWGPGAYVPPSAGGPLTVPVRVSSDGQETNSVITGKAWVNGVWRVMLSDGETYGPDNGLQAVWPSGALIEGKMYRWGKRVRPVTGGEAGPVRVTSGPPPAFSAETMRRLHPPSVVDSPVSPF